MAGGVGIGGDVFADEFKATTGIATYSGQTSFRVQSGSVNLGTIASGGANSVTVTFTPAFINTPTVVATMNAGVNNNAIIVNASGASTTGVTIGGRNMGGSSASSLVAVWIAIG